jgi:hypothetical protein
MAAANAISPKSAMTAPPGRLVGKTLTFQCGLAAWAFPSKWALSSIKAVYLWRSYGGKADKTWAITHS